MHQCYLSYISKALVCSFFLKHSRILYGRESWLRVLCAVDFPHSMQSLWSQPGPQPFCILTFFHLNGSFFRDPFSLIKSLQQVLYAKMALVGGLLVRSAKQSASSNLPCFSLNLLKYLFLILPLASFSAFYK